MYETKLSQTYTKREKYFSFFSSVIALLWIQFLIPNFFWLFFPLFFSLSCKVLQTQLLILGLDKKFEKIDDYLSSHAMKRKQVHGNLQCTKPTSWYSSLIVCSVCFLSVPNQPLNSQIPFQIISSVPKVQTFYIVSVAAPGFFIGVQKKLAILVAVRFWYISE